MTRRRETDALELGQQPVCLRLLAEILEGIQAPASMGMIGAADAPWRQLRDELNIMGWADALEHERALQRALGFKVRAE